MCSAPFGCPVLPELYMRKAASSGFDRRQCFRCYGWCSAIRAGVEIRGHDLNWPLDVGRQFLNQIVIFGLNKYDLASQ